MHISFGVDLLLQCWIRLYSDRFDLAISSELYKTGCIFSRGLLNYCCTSESWNCSCDEKQEFKTLRPMNCLWGSFNCNKYQIFHPYCYLSKVKAFSPENFNYRFSNLSMQRIYEIFFRIWKQFTQKFKKYSSVFENSSTQNFLLLWKSGIKKRFIFPVLLFSFVRVS